MKLLSKQEVNTLKTVERKKEIDEGAKLARKVDTLRELSAKEQVNLSKFSEESLKKIHADIKAAQSELDVIKQSIQLGAEELRTQMVSLDVEWDKINKEKKTLKEAREAIDIEQKDIHTLKDILDKQKDKDALDRKDIERLIEEAKKDRKTASDERKEAKKVLNLALTREKTINLKIDENIKTLGERELAIGIRERDTKSREDNNSKTSKELEVERLRLKDMRETLERAINRLKK